MHIRSAEIALWHKENATGGESCKQDSIKKSGLKALRRASFRCCQPARPYEKSATVPERYFIVTAGMQVIKVGGWKRSECIISQHIAYIFSRPPIK